MRLEPEDRLLEGAELEARIQLRASDPLCRAWNRAHQTNQPIKPIFYPNAAVIHP